MTDQLFRIGIDVGGTNTDAVVVTEADVVLGAVKEPTSSDVTAGVVAALRSVLAAAEIDRTKVGHIMLGTTHATNAVLQRRHLRRVAVIRIAGPATHAIPPLAEWPEELVRAVSAGTIIVDGGIEISGEPSAPLDSEGIRRFAGSLAGVAEAFAVTSLFSPISAELELQAHAIIEAAVGPVPISLSHEIGSLGLIERENATVLNAALSGVAESVVAGITNAVAELGLHAALYFAQNDGTLMDLDYVTRYPVLTIGSGPANSMRGAAHLSGLSEAVVIDVGGTSSDIGILAGGFPRESARAVIIGGIRTNFRMPDLVSVAVGGGTIVSPGPNGDVSVGPESVGYRLLDEALIFGGATATLTDAAVAMGRADLGDRAAVHGHEKTLRRATSISDRLIIDAIDAMKAAFGEVPLVAVGGGSVLLPDTIEGCSEVIRPDHYDVANAFGAAISSVSGEVDRIYRLSGSSRKEALADARAAATSEAIRAGADPRTVDIVRLDVVPLTYVAEPTIRVRAKAAGALRLH